MRLCRAIGAVLVASVLGAGCTESPSGQSALQRSADPGGSSTQKKDRSELSRKALGAIRKHAESHPEYGGVTDLEPTSIIRGEDYANNHGRNYAGKLMVMWTKSFEPQGGGYEYVFSVDRETLAVELVRRALGR